MPARSALTCAQNSWEGEEEKAVVSEGLLPPGLALLLLLLLVVGGWPMGVAPSRPGGTVRRSREVLEGDAGWVRGGVEG